MSDLPFDASLSFAAVPGVETTQGTAGGTIPCGRPSNSALVRGDLGFVGAVLSAGPHACPLDGVCHARTRGGPT